MSAKGLHCKIVDHVRENEKGVQPTTVQLTIDQFKTEMASAKAALADAPSGYWHLGIFRATVPRFS